MRRRAGGSEEGIIVRLCCGNVRQLCPTANLSVTGIGVCRGVSNSILRYRGGVYELITTTGACIFAVIERKIKKKNEAGSVTIEAKKKKLPMNSQEKPTRIHVDARQISKVGASWANCTKPERAQQTSQTARAVEGGGIYLLRLLGSDQSTLHCR